ncbi:hypothetical protein [Thalassovita aquimarina]|uniref:Uncharacterized protein n=1 Tax=Thalassovita aquimarina TaxID=2785917 RepID=A0ABS5HXE4_9RHOB|nr:hypothetical protein [Thalassovita aquimarina]MBR9653549.1 hypothetical protein [Thalassovita aquimarina]
MHWPFFQTTGATSHMRPGYQEILENAGLEVEYVLDFLSELKSTEETRKLWRAWSGFLEHYVKAVSAMRRATAQGKSKSWSDSLLHQQRNDAILQYAYQARDHASHVFEGKREANPRSVSLGGMISVAGNSSVSLSNNFKIGPDGIVHKIPDGVLKTENGRYAGGTIPKNAVEEHQHFLVLKDVETRSGVWPIPNPETHPEKRAIEIAEHVASWLEARLHEVKKLAAAEKK